MEANYKKDCALSETLQSSSESSIVTSRYLCYSHLHQSLINSTKHNSMTRIGSRRFVPSQNSRTFLQEMFLKLIIVNKTYLWTKISLRKFRFICKLSDKVLRRLEGLFSPINRRAKTQWKTLAMRAKIFVIFVVFALV